MIIILQWFTIKFSFPYTLNFPGPNGLMRGKPQPSKTTHFHHHQQYILVRAYSTTIHPAVHSISQQGNSFDPQNPTTKNRETNLYATVKEEARALYSQTIFMDISIGWWLADWSGNMVSLLHWSWLGCNMHSAAVEKKKKLRERGDNTEQK